MSKGILISITGGIGAGKSVVSRIVASMGYPVYDTDSRAKQIMDSSGELKLALRQHFGDEVIIDGRIDRRQLGDIVFNDAQKLATLNTLVHGAVIDDLIRWRAYFDCPVAFVETAILYESGLDKIVDVVWEVTAPEEVRISRVMARNGFSRDEVMARIGSQKYCPERPHPAVTELVNDGFAPLLPQVHAALASIQ